MPGWSRRRLLQATLACAPFPAAAAAPPPLPAPGALPVQQHRLANGLRVVVLPQPGIGTVAVQVWYEVGSRDDPPGRSGFAHLFEHLMFKRTRHLPDEGFDRLTEDVGGANNAFTDADVTVYQSEVPANHLERLLWAEAERMVHLQVDAANFASEREVVKEELRESVLADPYGRLYDALPAIGYARSPYRRPTIGRIDDLDAATLADVLAFHATHYRPDHAVLVIAGDVPAPDALRLAERHFGPVPRPARPRHRAGAHEPPWRAPRQVALAGPVVPLPAVALLWQAPAAGAPQAPALRVAAALLAGGDSARLPQALVHRSRLAQSVGCEVDLHADAGLLVVHAVCARGRGPGVVADALRAAVGRLAATPPTAAEFDKVRTQLLTAALVERQTPAGRAEAAGWAVVHHGDAAAADATLARLQAVRGADVQGALRRLLATPMVGIHYRQQRGAA